MTAPGLPRRPAGFHPTLESLRGVASIAVLAFHCTLCWDALASSDAAASFVSALLLIPLSGDAPVVLFFVLSAFVLTGALTRLGQATPGTVAAYAVRRFFRIVPAAWVALLATVVVIMACSRWPQYFEGTDYWVADYLSSANVRNLGGSVLFIDAQVNPMYWSLHVELVGSALMPLLWILLQRNKPSFAAAPVLALLLLLPFIPYRFGPLSHLSSAFLFSFACGTLAFHTVANHPKLAARLFSFPLGLSAAVLLVLAHNVIGPLSVLGPLLGHSERLAPILGEGPNVDLYAQHLLEGGAAAFLVGSVATHPERWPILMNPASRFFGRISYSLYVVHFAVIVACVVLLHKMLGGIPLDAPWSAPFLTVGLVLPLSIAAALLLHVAVERPGMTLGRHVARRMLGETAVAPRLGNFLR